ncbi:MAG: S8 family serine peptidase, partial [Psychroflexus sp.]
KEVANNNVDDDNNGYVDDVHGWNFLGDIVEENLEMTRIVRDYQDQFEGKTLSDVSAEDKEKFVMYKAAKAELDKEIQETQANLGYYNNLIEQLTTAQKNLTDSLKGEDLTLENLKNMQSDDEKINQQKMFLMNIMSNVGEDLEKAKKQLQGGIDYYGNRVDSHFNLDLNARAEKLGDDENDFTASIYGNNQVAGPDPKKEDAKHGTHVAGIVAAKRNNDIGMDGVAENVRIMAVRAVPDGDEYDKDIAMGIRYAVDNGAKVINTSFGKYHSPHPDKVNEAIAYAAKHDVLIINAAGNEGIDLDEKRVYPNDQWPENENEIVSNFINVGSITPSYGENLVSGFSNYGLKSVDVFSPGSAIYATTPLDKYEFLQGTSMASPNVAGVAAVLRSLFPKLSAEQIKDAIVNSGLTTDMEVIVGGNAEDMRPFNKLSKSGKMVNLYNAIIYASKL